MGEPYDYHGYIAVIEALPDQKLASWHEETKRLRVRFANSGILRPGFDRMLAIEQAEIERRAQPAGPDARATED